MELTLKPSPMRLALRLLVTTCPGLPGTVLGDTCCSGKILNNLCFTLKFLNVDHKLHVHPTHGRSVILKKGASSQAALSLRTGCTNPLRSSFLHFTSREAVAETCPSQWGRQWQGRSSVTQAYCLCSQGASVLHLQFASETDPGKGLYPNLCRFNSMPVVGSNPGIADIIWTIPKEDSLGKTGRAHILCGTRWGKNEQRVGHGSSNAHLSQLPFLCKSKWDTFSF